MTTANLTKRITLSNSGTAAFPIWTVWAEYDDEEGYCQDHLCEVIFRSPSKAEAEKFIKEQA